MFNHQLKHILDSVRKFRKEEIPHNFHKDPKDKKTLNELRFKLIHLERKLNLMKKYKINSTLDKHKHNKSDKKNKKKKKSSLKNNKVIINNNNKINIPGLKELHLLLKNHDSDLF